MENVFGELEASIQEKIDGDTDFQTSLEELSDDEKTEKLSERKTNDLNEALADIKGKTTKAEDIAKNQKIRAEKAENLLKGSKKEGEIKIEGDNLSTKDILALTKVDSEDYDEVIKVAKILDKPVSEALQDSTLKSILDTRVEERTTANATNTIGGARGGSKVDGESLLQKAEETGEVPDTEAGMKLLAEARIARAKAKSK